MITSGQSWDLDVLLPGGVRGEAFTDEIVACRTALEGLTTAVLSLPPVREAGAGALSAWRALLVSTFAAFERIQVVDMLAHCHASAHTDDDVGRVAVGRTAPLMGGLQRLLGRIARGLWGASDADLARLAEGLPDYGPWLADLRKGQSLDLAPELQDLVVEADRELLRGWSDLYAQVTARLQGRIAPDGAAELCATALTHIVGTRQMRDDRVGIDEMARSLHDNRVEPDVLEALWAGVDATRPALVRYLRAKARLLGKEALDWSDVATPVGPDELLSWEGAQQLILEAFDAAEPDLAASARRLLAEGAVESADRPHKRASATCFPFGARRTSRIFTTFSGTRLSAAMVAHELGHGWHADILYQVPMVRRLFTPAFAETASMYAENLVRDHAIGDGGQLGILDHQLQGGVSLLLDIRARHTFERECYRLRREGPLTAPLLCETMERCQSEAMGGALASYEPLLWVKKGHFYKSRTAFSNWPYAFGYLFSGALRSLPDIRIADVLLRTGWQDSRDLGRSVGIDLADPTFWAEAARPLVEASEQFERLSEASV